MDNWIKYSFHEIIEDISDGGTPSRTKSDYFGGTIPWVVIDDIEDSIYDTKEKLTEAGLKACSSKLWPKGTIILSTGATIGEVGIASLELATKQGICGIIVNDLLIDNVYFMYYLKYIKNQLLSFAQGSTIKEIRPNVILGFSLMAPKSLEEQRDIGNLLSKIDMTILKIKKNIEKYTRIKKGVMYDLLTKGIDFNGNIRSEETHEFKNSPFGRIPIEWEVEKIGNIYEMKSGTTPLRANKTFYDNDNGYNWVKTLDLNEGYIYSTEEKISQEALAKTSIKMMPKRAILIAMYGGWEQIGRTSILQIESATNQAVTSLYNPKVPLHAEFVQLILQHYRYKWKQFAVSTRKDPNITKSDIEQFMIVYPKDVEEQKQIANKISLIQRNIDINKKELEKLQRNKAGLMKDLLTGKVKISNLKLKAGGHDDTFK